MGKSKKKKSKKQRARDYYDFAYHNKSDRSYYDYHKKSKNKKGKTVQYEHPSKMLKDVKLSVSKKEIKEAEKTVRSPVEVPKTFKKHREHCNHAGKLISPAEFKEMTPAYAAYTPLLDAAIAKAGESNISVCKSCYDILVNPTLIDADTMKDAIVSLYLGANIVLAHDRMKKDEIKEIAKLRDSLTEWGQVIETMRKLTESGALDSSAVGGSTLTPEELAKLSRADTVQHTT